MKTVRQEVLEETAGLPGLPDGVIKVLTTDALEKFERKVWAKFDELRAAGAFKLWGVLDVSGLVEKGLVKILGPRVEKGLVGMIEQRQA